MESGPYQFYLNWFYPIERALCSLWPGLLAFQFVILAEPVISISHQLQALQTCVSVPLEGVLERQHK
jgi:hypothetical protein